jgi:hypothetical protein
MSSHERASLVPAAAVIPALRVYMNVVVVKKHIADRNLLAVIDHYVVNVQVSVGKDFLG